MRCFAFAGLTAVLLCGTALGEESGILQYPASFFADARPNTAYDMISRLPGFVFNDGQSARGFAGTAGNVLIDGERPASKTNDLQNILIRIPASDIDHIELIRGGAQGIDMHGQTVIANVVRKKTASTQIVLDVTDDIFANGQQIPAASLQFTHRAGASTYELAFETNNSWDDSVGRGLYDDTDLTTGTTKHYNSRYKNWGIGWMSAGAADTPLWGGRFKVNFTYQDSPQTSEYHYLGAVDPFSVMDAYGSKRGELGLHWQGPAGGVELETLVLQRLERDTDHQTQDAPGDLEVFSQRNRTAESIARATVRWRPNAALTVEGGAEGAYNQLDGASTYIVNAAPVALPSANARVDEKRGEVFSQAMWAFAPQWKLEAGSRFEYSVISQQGGQSREFFYPKPRVLLSWTPEQDTQIRLRAERVLGQLDFTNFVASANLTNTGVSAGNAHLAPDRHWQYELAFEQHFWERGAVSLSLQHEDISGVLDYIPVQGASGIYSAPGNIGGGHKNTIDLEISLPLDRLGLTNGLLKTTSIWKLTGVRDPATGETRLISGQRPRNYRFTLTQDIDSLKSTWSAYFFTGWQEKAYRPMQYRERGIPPLYIELEWDYKPTPQWMIAVAAKNANPFTYNDENVFYSGLRGSAAPVEQIRWEQHSQTRLFVEIRRTF
jgi:Outer membrane receptor proteins, mostly Fe transport